MPVFALYNFDDTDTTIRDSALGNGAQDGLYMNGATTSGGQVVLDGVNDIAKIFNSPIFQMDRGTLAIQFSQTAHVGMDPNTVLSRDSVGNADGGGFRIEVLMDGTIVVSHETPSDTVIYRTDPGFLQPGDDIALSYSWDRGGSEPGQLVIRNLTSGDTFTDTGTSGSPADFQRASCAMTSCITQSPIGTTRPVSSARSINSPGAITPRSGCCQRIRASKLDSRPLLAVTRGW